MEKEGKLMLGLFKQKQKTEQAKILLVDDEPDLIDTIQCRLEAKSIFACSVFCFCLNSRI